MSFTTVPDDDRPVEHHVQRLVDARVNEIFQTLIERMKNLEQENHRLQEQIKHQNQVITEVSEQLGLVVSALTTPRPLCTFDFQAHKKSF